VGHYLLGAFLISGKLLSAICYLLSATCYRLMPSADRNDLMPAPQEKLEWVTPKISLMEAEDTDGRGGKPRGGTREGQFIGYFAVNPS